MLTGEISKDADRLICLIYQGYLEDRESGKNKDEAKDLGDSADIFERHKVWSLDDVDSTCWELDSAGFLKCTPGDDRVYFAALSDEAIIYMENRVKKGLGQVVDFLTKLIP